MRKVRVLHIVQSLPIGGMERVAARVAAGLDPASFDCELWCLSGGGAVAEQLSRQGFPVRVFGYRRYLLPWNVASLSREIGRGGFDIVHTHTYAPGTLGRIAAKCAGVPVVVHHQHTDTASQMGARHKLTERLVTSLTTDRVIACSESGKRCVLREKFAGEKDVSVIYNGVPEEFSLPSGKAGGVRRELGLDGKRVVLTVASLTPHKGHIHLLKALPRIARLFPDVALVFVGDGPEKERLGAHARANGLADRVVLAGAREDVRPFLEAAEIFAAPSLRESMSLSIAEAMAKRLPVVASRVGGIPEVVADGRTGLLAEPADPDGLAAHIAALLGDGERRRAMGENGFAVFREKFTLEGMLRSVQSLYTELLKEKTAERPADGGSRWKS